MVGAPWRGMCSSPRTRTREGPVRAPQEAEKAPARGVYRGGAFSSVSEALSGFAAAFA